MDRYQRPGVGIHRLQHDANASDLHEHLSGLTTTKKGGYVQRAAEFGGGETADTIGFFLGRNGRRLMIRNRPQGDGAGLDEEIGEVTCIVSRTFNGRAQRVFALAVNIDGAFPLTQQP